MMFQIGQLIYVVSNKTQTVLPGLIQEENRSISLNGEVVSYNVLIGPQGSPKSRILDLSKVDGEVYGSLDQVKESLMQKFSEMLDEICYRADQNATAWYSNVNQQMQMPQDPNAKIDPAAIMNDITSGHQGNNPMVVNIQGNQAVPVNMQQRPTNLQQARKQLQDNLTDNSNKKLVQMPDGTLKEVE